MRLPYRRPRLDAEFLDQAVAQVPVDGQGFGLAAGAVEGEHQLAVVALPEGVVGDQRGQLRYERAESYATEGQFGVVAPFEDEEAGLREALREGVAAEFGGQAAERGAAPQGERRLALADGAGPVAGGVCGAGRGDVGLEDVDVEFALVDAEHIAGRDGAQPVGVVEETAQAGHVVVQGGVRGGRR
jgi:hypothetical protein